MSNLLACLAWHQGPHPAALCLQRHTAGIKLAGCLLLRASLRLSTDGLQPVYVDCPAIAAALNLQPAATADGAYQLLQALTCCKLHCCSWDAYMSQSPIHTDW